MKYINRFVFVNYLNCPTLGWMTKRNMLPRSTGLSNKLFRLEEKNIHEVSWRLFSDIVDDGKLKIVNLVNSTLLSFDSKTLCGHVFISGGYLAKADILQKLENNTWHLFDVKLGSKYKTKHIHDISFIVMVLAKLGVNVNKITILYLSNDYRLGMDTSKLFKELDCTEKVKLKSQEFLDISCKVFKDLTSQNMPKPYLKRSCRNCPIFECCMGRDKKNHIFSLPKLSVASMEKLLALGIDTIDKIPENFELNEVQKVVRNCVLTNTIYTSKNLKADLENLIPPFYYLDFESVVTVVPLYKNVAPHTQVLTQFSLDKVKTLGNTLNHYEYIADQTRNCDKEIAEKLIEYLDENGSIITYANFERVAIYRLANLFPDLCEKLNKIACRIVDLELIIRKNYYDISFCGRFSIKKILSVLVPRMNYKNLKIGNGRDASAAFAFIAMGFYDDKKAEDVKKNLLRYCAQDTLAMVRIHKFLFDVANKL
jgi:predicted RecB family nuclease